MTVVLLVRHGLCDPVGRSIAGRAPGVALNAEGRRQVEELSRALRPLALEAIYTSPLERARETAAALARSRGLDAIECHGLIEIDFGDWTGRTLTDLERDPVWRAFNERRGTVTIPGGESMSEVVVRAREILQAIRSIHPNGIVAAVSHGDVIRALIAHCLGLSLDRMLELEVAPASVSAIETGPTHIRVLSVNWQAGGPV